MTCTSCGQRRHIIFHPIEWMKNRDYPLAIIPVTDIPTLGPTMNGWRITRIVHDGDKCTVYGRKI